uniref:Uncharacterized protein n=1 Tax=Heterorhabditis bacteriophora TaxID=37862 RepID=A0A1I7WIK9_HETBA
MRPVLNWIDKVPEDEGQESGKYYAATKQFNIQSLK